MKRSGTPISDASAFNGNIAEAVSRRNWKMREVGIRWISGRFAMLVCLGDLVRGFVCVN